MNISAKTSIIAVLAVMGAGASAAQTGVKGMAVAYPFAFDKGTETARATAYDAAEGIARKAGYASVPRHVAEDAWIALGQGQPKAGHVPTTAQIAALAKRVKAEVVLFGSVAWHTRSIWVDTGPKTVSTASVKVYVYSVKSGKVIYTRSNEDRSDEKENGYKVAADILLTPVITAVSGGPATPREQRAVQIALARAYYRWAKR